LGDKVFGKSDLSHENGSDEKDVLEAIVHDSCKDSIQAAIITLFQKPTLNKDCLF
jgi:hypothetical protein